MFRHYLIDGCNVVRTAYHFDPAHLALDDWRSGRFVESISSYCLRRADEINVIIVFDGRHRLSDMAVPPGCGCGVNFSGPIPADGLIIEQARPLLLAHEPVTVVTADRALAQTARDEGARAIYPNAFLWELDPSARSHPRARWARL